jgi:hypothetical protein
MNKRMVYAAMVVLLVLSFTISTVGADTVSPQVNSSNEQPELSSTTPIPDDYVPSEDLILPNVTPPYPLTPMGNQWTTNRYPRLYFAKNELATAYKIYMYDRRDDSPVLLYKYKGGADNCGTSYCWLTPTTKLKPWKYDSDSGGYYSWSVSAKVDDTWTTESVQGYFYVMSTGKSSSFDVHTKGWEALTGTWFRNSKGYYKTLGILNTNATTWRKEYFTENVVIEVRMKRKEETFSLNRIYFMGYPDPLGATNLWNNGYCLDYLNTGAWLLRKIDDGVSSNITSGSTEYTEIADWNTFKIWVHDGHIYLWFNDVYMGQYTYSGSSYGAVGLSMYELAPSVSPLLVDYFNVYYSPTLPQAITIE